MLEKELKEEAMHPRPASSLQSKLSQVRNVFSAIRHNLNEGSTDK